jgi:hypothetical protein
MRKIKYTIEFCKELALKEGYAILDNIYIQVKSPMMFVHKECGNVFSSNLDRFLQGKRCPKCSGTMKFTIEQCKKFAYENGYTILNNKYLNCDSKLEFIHDLDTCGYKFSMTWYSFYKLGSRCLRCSGLKKHSLNDCKKEAIKRGYILNESVYTNVNTKMNFIHKSNGCNFSFYMKWVKFSNGNQGCPLCAQKQSESKIAASLKDYFYHNYRAETEYKECINPKTGRFLPYDICLEINSKKVYVEIQGEQHYNSKNNYYKTPEDFRYSQYKDKVKKKHAKNNGIFIEVDLRKIKTVDDAIFCIESQLL